MKFLSALCAGALVVISSGVAATPHHTPPEKVVLAPGYSALTFVAPAAGTYHLPVLGKASGGEMLDEHGNPLNLLDLMGDKIVLLSFIYTNCNDVNGCPLASFVLSKVQAALLEGGLAAEARLVSLSFDRMNDSPEVLREYAGHFREQGSDWQFLTAVSDGALKKTLDDYNQFIIQDKGPGGEVIGSISHILRVYLIDREKQIRNIYSVSFLHPDIIVSDIQTINMDTQGEMSGP